LINDLHIHEKINGILLDRYLALGWYRMGQFIFTTNSITNNNKNFNVLWLRYIVNSFELNKTQKLIIKKNENFTTIIKPFTITSEVEALYCKYLTTINFEAAPSLHLYLSNGEEQLGYATNVFDSYCIEVRDNNTLIALGVFDTGMQSIAGIVNIYDPAYKQYSLGKYLMLLKILACVNNNIAFYYPGYIVKGWPKFDYKLFLGKAFAETFNPENLIWEKYKTHIS
jgi:leucyl-tRNA---protein transferase